MIAFARRARDESWGVSPTAEILWFGAPFAAALGTALLWLLDKEALRLLADEDGPWEWAQVAFFAAAAVSSCAVAFDLVRGDRRAAGVLFAVLAAGLFFITGEEIAWGQHLFGFHTPAGLAAVNEKAEISVHNIASITKWFTRAKLVAGAYGALGVWILALVSRHVDLSVLRPCVVPAFLSSPFLIVLAMRVARLTFLQREPVGYGEFDELLLAWGLATFAGFSWRLERRRAAGSPEPSTAGGRRARGRW